MKIKEKVNTNYYSPQYGEYITIPFTPNGLVADFSDDIIEIRRNHKTVKVSKGEVRALMDYINKDVGFLTFNQSIPDEPEINKITCDEIKEYPWSKILRFKDLKQFVDNNRDLDGDTPVLIERVPDHRVEWSGKEVIELEGKKWKREEEWCKKLSKDFEREITPKEESKDQFFVASYIEKDEAVLIYCGWYEKR